MRQAYRRWYLTFLVLCQRVKNWLKTEWGSNFIMHLTTLYWVQKNYKLFKFNYLDEPQNAMEHRMILYQAEIDKFIFLK